MSAGDNNKIIKIMSATRAEFLRSLAHFAPDQQYTDDRSSYSFPLTKGQVMVETKVLPNRAVTGLLGLPQLEVTLTFKDALAGEEEEFMRRFDLAFRRGGG
mgnify:CR=1 FL=1